MKSEELEPFCITPAGAKPVGAISSSGSFGNLVSILRYLIVNEQKASLIALKKT